MSRILTRAFSWLAAPIIFLLAAAAWMSLGRSLWQIPWSQPDSVFNTPLFAPGLALMLGFGLRMFWAMACQRMGRDNPFVFIDTLEHELTHALFGYLTLSPPVSLKATLRGEGEVLLKGQNPLTLLAPYFFPLFAMLGAGMSAMVASTYRSTWSILCFGLLGNFMFRLMAEYRWRQTDLHAYGVVFSTSLVACLLPLMLGTFSAMLGILPWSWILSLPGEVRDIGLWIYTSVR